MSNSQVMYSPITGLSTINSDNVLTNGLSSVEQDTELIKIDVMDNFNSAFVTLKSTIIPDVTNSYTLGTTLLRFSDIYTEILDANAVSFTNLTITGTLDVNGATTLGTVSTGVWNGSVITNTYIDTGIADDKIVEIDSASVTDNDYAKFTANGLEGRSYTEVKTDLSLDLVENSPLSTFSGSGNIVATGTLDSGAISSNFGAIDIGSSSFTGNELNLASDITQFKDSISSNIYTRRHRLLQSLPVPVYHKRCGYQFRLCVI